MPTMRRQLMMGGDQRSQGAITSLAMLRFFENATRDETFNVITGAK
jgi:hypothetical protein